MIHLISTRHKTGHIIRRDTELGTYEEINSPLATLTELQVQRALLCPAPSNLDLLWNQKRTG